MRQTREKMKQNTITIFKSADFGMVRTMVSEQGEPLFCLKDVCLALALDGKQVRRRLDDGVVSKHPIVDSLGRTQLVSFVNEDGLYDVVLDSRKAEARKFRKWITSEVLPQIRQTGGYIPTRDAQGRQLSEQEVVRVANRIAQRTVKQKNLAADNCLSASEVAKRVGLGDAKLLNSMLVDRGVIKWTGGRYRLTPEYEGRGLAQDRFFLYRSLEGEQKERSYLVWTLTGADFIEDFLHF